MVTRQEVLSALHASLADRFAVDFQQFAAMVCDWDIEPIIVDGRVVGGVMTRGDEIHVGVIPEGRRRWLTRSLVRKTLGHVMNRYGRATTKVMRDNAAGHQFVTRLGFRKCAEDADLVYYVCKDMSNG